MLLRIRDDLQNILRILRGLKRVSACPKRVDIPCVFCLECERSKYDEIVYEDGLLKITANSVLLNLKLDVGEAELDKALLLELAKAFSSRLSFVMEKPEEGYQFSFFFFHTDKDAIPLFERFIDDVLPQIGGILTQGRINVRNWARSVVQKFFS